VIAKPPEHAAGYDRAAIARRYDRIAVDYAARLGDDPPAGSGDRAFVEVALESALGDGPVLDLGCGPGQIAAISVASGMRAVGVDISTAMLAIARRRVRDGAFLAAEAWALPLRTVSCRAVAAFYCLHHISRGLIGIVLDESRRVLATGGTLIVATHLGSGEQWVTGLDPDDPTPICITLYGMDELAAKVRGAGFAIESVGTRAPRPDEFQAEHGFLRARAA
jgi:ubiquinone/menaquinone biosynthesis C-methylase UbiE